MLNLITNNIGIILGIVGVLIILAILASGYVKAPTDKAYVISGLKKEARIVIGKAAIKIPFLERKDELELQLIQIDVKTSSTVPTADYINIRVDSTVNVKIGKTSEYLESATQNFLNKDVQYIANVAREVLEGNIREIIGKMKLQEMVGDRQKFGDLVRENAAPDLAKMGLELINFNVQNYIDEHGVIENLGVDNIENIRKNAAISKSIAQQEIAQAQAEADKKANDARIASQQAIAEKNNELAIKKAELKIAEDTKQAEADVAYEIQKEEKRKIVEAKIAEANIVKQQKEIELKENEAIVQEKTLEATIKKQADADLYDSQKQAEADLYKRQKEAEARRIEIQQAADAEKYKIEKEAEAVEVKANADLLAKQKAAEGIEAVGKAEAAAIQAKLLAEAEGLDKKAEAMNKMQQASIIEIVMNKLPEIVKNAAEPLSNVDSITMYGEGNSSKLIGDIMKTSSQIIEGVESTTGLDIKALLAGALGGKLMNNKDIVVNVDTNKEETQN